MRERQFAIWNPQDLSKPLHMGRLDASTGVIDIFYDEDSSLVVLAGKVRFFFFPQPLKFFQ
jgi:hypothetical protein